MWCGGRDACCLMVMRPMCWCHVNHGRLSEGGEHFMGGLDDQVCTTSKGRQGQTERKRGRIAL